VTERGSSEWSWNSITAIHVCNDLSLRSGRSQGALGFQQSEARVCRRYKPVGGTGIEPVALPCETS